MIPKPLPADLAIQRCELNWSDALWGLDNGWVTWSFLVALAIYRLEQGLDTSRHEVELAGVGAEEWYEAVPLAETLAENDTAGAEETSQTKWLYLILRWVYDNRDSLEDPLGIVEEVYAEFGYPEDMTAFVRYMPVSDEYDPQEYSMLENETRLLACWRNYLANHEAEFERSRDAR